MFKPSLLVSMLLALLLILPSFLDVFPTLWAKRLLFISALLITVSIIAHYRFEEKLQRIKNLIANRLIDPNLEQSLSTGEQEKSNKSSSLDQLAKLLNWSFEWQNQRFSFMKNELSSLMNAITDGILVINDDGQITLFNKAASDILRAPDLSTGASLFSYVRRDKLLKLLDSTNTKQRRYIEIKGIHNQKIEATLTRLEGNKGYVFCFESMEAPLDNKVVHDLNLAQTLDNYSLESAINSLPVVVIDIETTGLNVHEDAIIAFAGIHANGTEKIDSKRLEILIKPDHPIRPSSLKIHRIEPSALKNKPMLSQSWQDIQSFMTNRVIVGHHIGFDVAVMKNNLARQGHQWQPHTFLDTQLLAQTLVRKLPDQSLDRLIEHFGINTFGRHTAMGDALMTFHIFARLLLLAVEAGDVSLTDLINRQNTQKNTLEQHRKIGWTVSVESKEF